MIDNKTSRLQLPLPNVENYLEEDVERLSEALTTLDGVVATIAEDGKLVQDQVPEYVARLDTEGKLPSDNLPISAVQTDAEGKIPESVVPEAIARDSEVLSRNGNLSELADRAAAWLNVRPVGSTPLAGDPVGDYDAATKRWVQNLLNTGSVGPTMNGVMNYGVGDFHLRDSRAFIQPYEVVSDGQLLNRADWPELWAYAQMLSPITDAEWVADKFKRGRYSTGNGTTTFRVPDRNGVQRNGIGGFTGPSSVPALYGRGDGSQSAANGNIFESAAPNITGGFNTVSSATVLENNDIAGAMFGALKTYKYADTGTIIATGADPAYPKQMRIDASRSSPIYGAATDEIMGRNFVGVWVIRASGGFVAANSSWSVINGDKTLPGNNTSISGGYVQSDYKVSGVSEGTATLRMAGTVGATYSARLSIYNKTKATTVNFDFSDDGNANIPGSINIGGPAATRNYLNIISTNSSGNSAFINFVNVANNATYGRIYSERNGDLTIQTTVGGGTTSQKYFQFLQAGNAVCAGGWGTTSDERIKTNIQRVPNALKEVYGWRGATWDQDVYGPSFGIGLIAQDVEKSCPKAVTRLPEVVQSTGVVIKDVRTINTGNIAAAYHTEAIRTLFDLLDLALNDPEEARARVAQLKAEIANSQ